MSIVLSLKIPALSKYFLIQTEEAVTEKKVESGLVEMDKTSPTTQEEGEVNSAEKAEVEAMPVHREFVFEVGF